MSLLHAREDKAPVWLLGVSSMLGWSIATHARMPGLELYCSPHTRIPRGARWHRLGLQNRADVAAAFTRAPPSLIIHCAGICDVEKCEASPAFALAVNVQGMDNLLRHTPASTRLVYVSSDHVFSGDSGPYTESSPPDPISYYGHTRVAAEAMLRERRPDAPIVRAGLWIGPSYNGRQGHLDWLRYRSARDLPMTVVRDEHRSAVWADEAAERTLALALSDISGIRHVVAEHMVARPVLAHYLNQRFAIGAALGRFHGPRHLWLEPAAEAVARWRMGLGVELTLLLALLHLAVFAWASRGARADGAAVAAEQPSPPA